MKKKMVFIEKKNQLLLAANFHELQWKLYQNSIKKNFHSVYHQHSKKQNKHTYAAPLELHICEWKKVHKKKGSICNYTEPYLHQIKLQMKRIQISTISPNYKRSIWSIPISSWSSFASVSLWDPSINKNISFTKSQLG